MADQPTIQFTFANEYPGRFPGELGVYSKTILEFVDLDGKMASLIRKVAAFQIRIKKAATPWPWPEGKPPSWGRVLMSGAVQGWCDARIERLNEKMRQLMLRRLRELSPRMNLTCAPQTESSGFHPVEHAYQADEIAEKLESANGHWAAIKSQ